jgi:hypothetical protein
MTNSSDEKGVGIGKGALAPSQRIVSCGDISCELLVDPIPRPKPAPIKITVKPTRRRVVLVDNKKPNSLAILTRAHALLRTRGIEVRDDILVKPLASVPMPDEMMDELANEFSLIVCGISD